MRRVFPVIVLLITLSVLGITFIQISWISNAISLKQSQFQEQVKSSLEQSRDNMYNRHIMLNNQILPTDSDRQYYLSNNFTSQYFNREEIQQMISSAFRKNNLKQPLEFTVTDIFNNQLFSSDNFNKTLLSKSDSIKLTPENSKLKETLFVYINEDKSYLIREMAWMIVASIIFTIIIISAFTLTVRTLFNQKKLSEIKSDFINNMTHELKTPLATISLAIDALTNKKVINDSDQVRYYSSMIKEENKRMNKQVEKILQAARLEKKEIKLNLQELDAHEVIRKVAENLILQIQEKNGTLTLKLEALNHIIQADDVHFSNIIFNLLDNAIKYSKGELHINVNTGDTGKFLAISIKDNGIGMSKETQSRIFEKFYRAHTGNLHDVKGFGLGLSYVKATVEAHGGKVKVDSTPGKGSTFTIYMPVKPT